MCRSLLVSWGTVIEGVPKKSSKDSLVPSRVSIWCLSGVTSLQSHLKYDYVQFSLPRFYQIQQFVWFHKSQRFQMNEIMCIISFLEVRNVENKTTF